METSENHYEKPFVVESESAPLFVFRLPFYFPELAFDMTELLLIPSGAGRIR